MLLQNWWQTDYLVCDYSCCCCCCKFGSECCGVSACAPEPRSVGVIGPADCGVKPGGWAINFCRTSRIFNCKLCLLGKMLLWANWKLLVACDVGNIPWSWNNCMTKLRRCSRTLRWPLSSAELTDRAEGVFGVRGERSALSVVISLYCSMLKSGPKKRLPTM